MKLSSFSSSPLEISTKVSRLEPQWSTHSLSHTAHRASLLRTPQHGYLLGLFLRAETRKTRHDSDGIGDLVLSPDGRQLASTA